jgi:hypothetical protein
MKKLAVAATLALASFFGVRDAGALVDVEARYWFTSFDETLNASSGGVTGTDIDVVEDLDMDGGKSFWEGRVTLELGSHRLRYSFMPLSWDGTETLTKDLTFAGRQYTASTDVYSEFDIAYHRLGYEYDFIDVLDNRVGVIAELKYFDGEARLAATALGFDESESLAAPIPAIGVAAQVGLPFLLSVGGEITGITLGSQAYLVDVEAAVNVKPMPFVSLSAGYRFLTLHLEQDDNSADMTLQGPYIMLKGDF